MTKYYELVVFTASLSKYADPLVDILDPNRRCSYRLFREHCTYYNNSYVKDLTRVGRPMENIIILDNSPIAYLFQPENAMPILSWYEDMTDRELYRFTPLFERLAYVDDVRKYLPKLVTDNLVDPKKE
jgi:RNA polymerase II subunit A small phosphatase-like protein